LRCATGPRKLALDGELYGDQIRKRGAQVSERFGGLPGE
jgi:hypothetical protein